MFYFTIVLVLAYAVALGMAFASSIRKNQPSRGGLRVGGVAGHQPCRLPDPQGHPTQ